VLEPPMRMRASLAGEPPAWTSPGVDRMATIAAATRIEKTENQGKLRGTMETGQSMSRMLGTCPVSKDY